MNRFVMMVLVLVLAVACRDTDSTSEVVAKSEYLLVVTGDHEFTLVGDDLESAQWGPNEGYIYLSTDKKNEPLGTLTMFLGEKIVDGSIVDYGLISAHLSKTDVRVGTAEELNARTYELEEGIIENAEIGSNFFAGYVNLKMRRVLVWPWDEPENVEVKGAFVAKEK